MTLQYSITGDAFEGLDDSVKGLYKKLSDGSYALDVDGDKSTELKAKVDEFRSTNVNLMKQMDDLKKQYKGFENINPQDAKDAIEKLRDIQEQKLIDENKVDEVVKLRTESMRTDFEAKIKAFSEKLSEKDQTLTTAQQALKNLRVEQEVMGTIPSVGELANNALPDVLSRIHSVYKTENDKLVPYENGVPLYSAEDPNKPMPIGEYLPKLVEKAPHLFQGSSGGGSNGSGKAKSGVVTEIAGSDKTSFSANLEKIAKGEVKVDVNA